MIHVIVTREVHSETPDRVISFDPRTQKVEAVISAHYRGAHNFIDGTFTVGTGIDAYTVIWDDMTVK